MNATFRVLTVMTPDKRQLRAGIWRQEGAGPRAICVLLNGLTEFLEKYGEVAEELCARGFIAIGLDWRGQGASERWRTSNQASHVGSFEEYDRDLAALLLQAVESVQRDQAAPLPVFALAHSMGAHILLRLLHDQPRRLACAVLVSPMLAVDLGTYSEATARLIAGLMNLTGPSSRFVFGVEERDPLTVPFSENRVTSDEARFERTRALLKAQPYLRIFGPTFGWLGAAFKSMRRMIRASYAKAITTPLLVFGASNDRIVHVGAIRDFVKKLPNAHYQEIAGAGHEILMEKDEYRALFWAAFDTFLEAQLKNPGGFAAKA